MRVCEYGKTCALVIGLACALPGSARAQSPSGGCPTSEHCSSDSDCNDGDYCDDGKCMSVDACDVPLPELPVPVAGLPSSSAVDEGSGCEGGDSAGAGCEGGGGGGDCSIAPARVKHRGGGYGTGALFLGVLFALRLSGWRQLKQARVR